MPFFHLTTTVSDHGVLIKKIIETPFASVDELHTELDGAEFFTATVWKTIGRAGEGREWVHRDELLAVSQFAILARIDDPRRDNVERGSFVSARAAQPEEV